MSDTSTPYAEPGYDAIDKTGRAEGLAVEWLTWARDVRGLSTNTLLQYNKVMRKWLQFCHTHDIEPLKPTLTDLEAFRTRKRENGRKGKPSTQASDVAALRGWYKWMHERGKLPSNPSLDLRAPVVKATEGRPIEDEHWVAMWQSPLPDRLRVCLAFGFYCGLRRAEIGELTTDQVTPTRIVRFIRKGGEEQTLDWHMMATVFEKKLPHLLPDMGMLTSVVERVRHSHDRIIPWQRPKELTRRMYKLCASLDIPQYTPHQLRHSTATNLLRAGVRPHLVMRLMNHKSFDQTMSYVRAGSTDLDEWLNTL